MREIMYRGMLLYKESKGPWVFGNLIVASNGNPHIILKSEVEEDGHHLMFDDRPSWVDPDSVGQFTGKKDSKGREIFEGDIVEDARGCRSVVQYVNGGFHCNEDAYSLGYYSHAVTVIGNVYDNPELLAAAIIPKHRVRQRSNR
jgi:hypothetical protein